jgi:hypothetical protein
VPVESLLDLRRREQDRLPCHFGGRDRSRSGRSRLWRSARASPRTGPGGPPSQIAQVATIDRILLSRGEVIPSVTAPECGSSSKCTLQRALQVDATDPGRPTLQIAQRLLKCLAVADDERSTPWRREENEPRLPKPGSHAIGVRACRVRVFAHSQDVGVRAKESDHRRGFRDNREDVGGAPTRSQRSDVLFCAWPCSAQARANRHRG